MTLLNVEFLRYEKEGLNGDRALHSSPYSVYEVKINNGFDSFLAATFNQYDHFYCHIKSGEDTYKEARKYADDLADILGVVRSRLQKMRLEKVVVEKWVPDNIGDAT